LLRSNELAAFMQWAHAHFEKQSDGFRNRFRPALNGLTIASEGRPLGSGYLSGPDARQFLGWTNTKHWLLTDQNRSTQ